MDTIDIEAILLEHRKNLNNAKKKLSEVVKEVKNSKGYKNKTYTGFELANALAKFSEAWSELIYRSNAFPEYKKLDFGRGWYDASCYTEQIREWKDCWAHEFNKEVWLLKRPENAETSFKYPEFLEDLLDITSRFLKAKTEKTERSILEYTWYYTGKSAFKARWVTAADLETKSYKLPMYFACDLSQKTVRGRKLYNKIREVYKDHNPENYVADIKEYWRLARIAVKKGLLIDNYGKQ